MKFSIFGFFGIIRIVFLLSSQLSKYEADIKNGDTSSPSYGLMVWEIGFSSDDEIHL